MKKFFSYITLFHILFLNLSFFTFDTAKASTPIFASDNYFVVTAYYSPLPNQKYYFKGSYEADMRLNGRGIAGASGKPVFPGMFAAPKGYLFGTKIYIEGIGVGEVADRGGAIVSTDMRESRGYSYDRIDIWMGHGEEGLARALAFGKKTLKGYVLADSNTEVSINLNSIPAPLGVLAQYEVKNTSTPQIQITQNTPTQTTPTIQAQPLISRLQVNPVNPKTEDVKKLQSLFTEMGMYSGKIDGKYESVKQVFVSYQSYRGIISGKESKEAGYFGDKTTVQLNKDYALVLAKKQEQEKIKTQLAQIKKSVDTRVQTHINNIGNPKAGDVGEHVRNLQKTLKTLGYFKVADTAIFGDTTKNSLVKYQIDKGIITSEKDTGAGVFGPKTKEVLKGELAVILENQLLKERNLLSYKK